MGISKIMITPSPVCIMLARKKILKSVNIGIEKIVIAAKLTTITSSTSMMMDALREKIAVERIVVIM